MLALLTLPLAPSVDQTSIGFAFRRAVAAFSSYLHAPAGFPLSFHHAGRSNRRGLLPDIGASTPTAVQSCKKNAMYSPTTLSNSPPTSRQDGCHPSYATSECRPANLCDETVPAAATARQTTAATRVHAPPASPLVLVRHGRGDTNHRVHAWSNTTSARSSHVSSPT
ncbi:hypothetical protein IWX49DRAFT_226775 [Phyllosticta citricarpa]